MTNGRRNLREMVCVEQRTWRDQRTYEKLGQEGDAESL